MNHTADHADADADQAHPESPMSSVDDQLAHLHALVDAFVARAQELRALHNQYRVLQREETSDERREELLHLLQTEQAVLDGSRSIHEQVDEFLRVQREMVVRTTSKRPRPPKRAP